MTIKFKGVRIRRDWKGRLEGSVGIDGVFGTANLVLNEDLCAKILDVCADNIVQAAVEISDEMKRESISTRTIDDTIIDVDIAPVKIIEKSAE